MFFFLDRDYAKYLSKCLISANPTHLINHLWGGIKTITILTIMSAIITLIQYIIHKKTH